MHRRFFQKSTVEEFRERILTSGWPIGVLMLVMTVDVLPTSSHQSCRSIGNVAPLSRDVTLELCIEKTFQKFVAVQGNFGKKDAINQRFRSQSRKR